MEVCSHCQNEVEELTGALCRECHDYLLGDIEEGEQPYQDTDVDFPYDYGE
jgi:hypothetical protein